jgi:hypothetical protein
MLPKQLVLIGGGASIKEGLDKGLKDLIPKTFSCALNFAYKYFNSTLICGIDEKFFNENYKDITKMPLFLGKANCSVNIAGGRNCYLFQHSMKYDRELFGGIYSSTLAGLFALSTFIKLMDIGEIYLLGFDYGPIRDLQGRPLVDKLGRPLTHFYQEETNHIEHRGIGKTNWYTATIADPNKKSQKITNAQKEFGVYANETKVKIYNVNPQSAIPTFEKITYDEFFKKIEPITQTQDEIRKELENKFKGLIYMYECIRKGSIKFDAKGQLLTDQGSPFLI